MKNYPVLYSYRRCPYAMRARMAIYLSGIEVEQREIVFWDKPEPMLNASPKGTVPVLVLPSGLVVDESRDIMLWAFENAKDETCYQAWLFAQGSEQNLTIEQWINQCDYEFKPHLDKYKYADRFPERSQSDYRDLGCMFLNRIESALGLVTINGRLQSYVLVGQQFSMADIAIFPFVRQFVNVDKEWFEQAHYPKLKVWLQRLLESDFFKAVMKNRPVWQSGHSPLWVAEPGLVTKHDFSLKALS